MTDKTFEYLLNRMEHAASQDEPAKHGYAAARKAVLFYAKNLHDLAAGRGKLLACYRTGSHHNAGTAIDLIRKADANLEHLAQSVKAIPSSEAAQ